MNRSDQLLYTNENRLLVNHMHNLLVQAEVEHYLKNEFLSAGAGELAPMDTWLEIWVEKSRYHQAKQVINQSFESDNTPDWLCSICHEANGSSFGSCWQCQNLR